MKSLFINSTENRLKAGWRILLFVILFLLFANTLILGSKPIIADEITKKEFISNYGVFIISFLAFGATIATLLARKFFDKKSFESLGLKINKQAFKDLGFGFLLSFLMAGVFFGILLAFGLIEFQGINFDGITSNNTTGFVEFMSVVTLSSIGIMLLETILVGYWEELVFRGYVFQNMREGLGLVLSIIISCILYGIIHAANPNATLLSSAIIVGFGYLRLYGYLSTKMLWLSLGMHIGWNFFQGPIFGFAASGHSSATLLQHSFTSETEYLTGGEFGPEGSLFILPILLVILFVMKWYARKNYSELY